MLLEPQMAQLIAQLAEGVSLHDALDFISQLYPDADFDYLRTQLVKLNRLGILWTLSSCAK